MAKTKKRKAPKGRAAVQKTLSQLWDEHVQHEFSTRSHEDTLRTMVEDAYVNHVPVLTGGSGHDELREFYSKTFHSTDAARHRDDAGLANHRREPSSGRDQASVLVQIGLLDPAKLPVAGVETARKVLDPSLPANELMKRGSRG